MTRRLLVSSITVAALLTVTSPGLADPITITSNGTGIAGLAFASENGVEDLVSRPDTPAGTDSFHLTARVGGTSADASAAIISNLSDPLRLSATGSTSVAYTTTDIGGAEGNVSSHFFVFFELDTPHEFAFNGQFETSGDAFSTREQEQRSEWNVFLLQMGPGLSTVREVLVTRRTDSASLVDDGLLAAGLYRFVVQSTSFGGQFVPAPVSRNVFSNFTFGLDLHPSAAPVPEPGSLLLMGTGVGAVLLAARRRKGGSVSR